MGTKITKIGVTNEKISARGGLSLILRYIENIGLYGVISNIVLSLLVRNNKGLQLPEFLKQMFAFCIDGTHTAISHFDQMKTDQGYAAILETNTEELASSHQVKRFFIKMIVLKNHIFNKILHELFVWRLNIECPKIIILGIDTMVLDNDGAKKREGCESTYKKKKGYQPLHVCWGAFLVDVLFRKGSAHSNHGNDYTQRVKCVVELIRRRYSPKVPIILCADSGFADQKAYEYFEEELGIHYITTSKIYTDVKDYVGNISTREFGKINKGKAEWNFIEFGNKLKSWKKFRRCIFTKLYCDEQGQYIMEFDKPDNVIYTNIGNCKEADDKLRAAGGEAYFETGAIIGLSHQRGADELIHRSLKELATKEQLPFKRFGMNRAYYFILVISHFIFEAYKRDVTADVIPVTSYPNTFRRKLIDFAAKVTKGARSVTLKVSNVVYNMFSIKILWERCQSPPQMKYI
jgi:hypothetical protein